MRRSLLLALLTYQQVAAVQVETTFTLTYGKVSSSGGVNQEDADLLSASAGDDLSNPAMTTIDYTANYADTHLNSYQDSNGFSSLRYESLAAGGDGALYNNELWTQIGYKVTNDSATPQLIFFDFSVSHLSLQVELVDSPGDPIAEPSGGPHGYKDGAIGLEYTIDFNGHSGGSLYDASYYLWSQYIDGYSGYEMRSGYEKVFSPTITALSDSGFTYGFIADFDNINESISLGMFNPGESKEIYVEAKIITQSNDYEPYFKGSLNDPNLFSGGDSNESNTSFRNVGIDSPCDELFFSEYVDGSEYLVTNKALEIFNPTGDTISLDGYAIDIYGSGLESLKQTISLTGEVASKDVFVIVNPNTPFDIRTNADQIDENLVWTSGDDAIVLRHNDTIVDSLGQVGDFRDTPWSSGGISTRYVTLVRKPDLVSVDSNISDTFYPSIGWDALPFDTLSDLGHYAFEGCRSAMRPNSGILIYLLN